MDLNWAVTLPRLFTGTFVGTLYVVNSLDVLQHAANMLQIGGKVLQQLKRVASSARPIHNAFLQLSVSNAFNALWLLAFRLSNCVLY